MSGLTPILDTLLHHVLGKRGDVQRSSVLRPDRIVNEVTASTASKSVAGDSRLQAPGPQAGLSDGDSSKAAVRADGARSPLAATSDPTGPQARPSGPEEAGRDARLRLSQPGQFISHLQRSTGEGLTPTVRPPGFLMDATTPSAPPADGVAQRLGSTIRESGLFYESHLQQWHRGDKSVAELSREPQMRIWQRAIPVAPADSGPAHDPVRAPGMTDDQRQLPVDSQDRLQTIVRNQLELFGAATLRWEGEVDDGFLMFMEISLPEDHRRGDGDEDASISTDRESGEEWATTLELELPLLGDITVALRRTADRLSVELGAERWETAALMNERVAEIAERLASRGVPSPTIRVGEGEQDAGGRDDAGA